jgi:hypothetical protein
MKGGASADAAPQGAIQNIIVSPRSDEELHPAYWSHPFWSEVNVAHRPAASVLTDEPLAARLYVTLILVGLYQGLR